jgi:putative phosphoribosyl transferase
VIIVDDGIATGSTARAACEVARAHGARRIVFAAPVGPVGVESTMTDVADQVVVTATPSHFFAIGQFYDDFTQLSDEQVIALLDQTTVNGTGGDGRAIEVTIATGAVELAGDLTLVENAREVVVFAHGSGSSRGSPRNRFVATVLHDAGLGTLLFDLLTPGEERDRANVFDIDLLGRRLVAATDWLRARADTDGLTIGYFGASTGAAAALRAASIAGNDIAAVVSRGGRPDLARAALGAVRAPTLLIVGGEDTTVLGLNREAYDALGCERQLEIVPGASHLFEEPGTLATAAALAREWFLAH